MEVRLLSESGLDTFEAFIRERQLGSPAEVPHHLLTDPDSTTTATFGADLEQREFRSRIELARYIDGLLGSEAERLGRHPGLWSWLALFYFDQLCPTDRRPKQSYKYLVRPDDDWRTYYRHLVYGPWSIFRRHGEKGRLLLAGPVRVHPDLAEQFAARQEFVTNDALMEVADVLYWDEEAGRPKTGATSADRAGSVRRLIAVAQQLDLTYDMYGMDAASILSLLPPEFETWLS